MQVAVLRPDDDQNLIEVFLVEHRTDASVNFTNDFNNTRASMGKEYDINDILNSMEKDGWQILRTDHTEVFY